MTFTYTTTVCFLIPDENEECKAFIKSHDMDKWRMDCVSSLIIFEQTQTIFTTITVEGDQE